MFLFCPARPFRNIRDASVPRRTLAGAWRRRAGGVLIDMISRRGLRLQWSAKRPPALRNRYSSRPPPDTRSSSLFLRLHLRKVKGIGLWGFILFWKPISRNADLSESLRYSSSAFLCRFPDKTKTDWQLWCGLVLAYGYIHFSQHVQNQSFNDWAEDRFSTSHLQQRAMAILVDWCFTDVDETDTKKQINATVALA